MDTHIKVVGWLHVVFGAIGVLIGLAVFAFFGGLAGIASSSNEPDAWVLGGIGGLVLVVMLLLSVPAIVAGVGLISLKPWARILGIVICALELIQVPFGTLLGLYGLWALLSAEGTAMFARRAIP